MTGTTTRFYRRGDVLTSRVCWVLTDVFGLGETASQDLLDDPRHRMLMLVDGAGLLAGFVVFVDRRAELVSAENAFVGLYDRRLLSTTKHPVYGFEQVWFRDDEFDTARVLQELLPVMALELQAQGPHSLIAVVPEDERGRALCRLLEEIGFEPGEWTHGDWCIALDSVAQDDQPGDGGATALVSFCDPPDNMALIGTFNRVFGQGRGDLTAEQLQTMYKRSDFLPEASLWMAQGEQVALFAWLFEVAPSQVRLALLASDPQIRGTGQVGNQIAAACARWRQLGMTHLHFTIREDNAAPLAMAQRLGARLTRAKRSWILSG